MESVKLNIGAGGTKMDGFISVDKYNQKADIKRSCDDTGFNENTVDEIYSSHMVEHLERMQLIKTLKHWFEILKPGCKVIVRCPNAAVYIEEWLGAYYREDVDYLLDWGTRNVVGWEDKGVGMWHRFLFTKDTLMRVFDEIGFEIIDCITTETRVTNKNHFEYREHGDILLTAIKPSRYYEI